MKRYLHDYILADLPNKITLLMGARQSGKTTLAKSLVENYDYFNYDSAEDRLDLQKKSWEVYPDQDKMLNHHLTFDRMMTILVFSQMNDLKFLMCYSGHRLLIRTSC